MFKFRDIQNPYFHVKVIENEESLFYHYYCFILFHSP